jgi:hypothetical protein
MDPIAAVLSVVQSRQTMLAATVNASMTRKALDQMQIQAAHLLDAMPPPPPMSTTRGGQLDVYA